MQARDVHARIVGDDDLLPRRPRARRDRPARAAARDRRRRDVADRAPARAARRRTSRPGSRRSAARRGSSASAAPTTRALSPRRACSSSGSSSSGRSSRPATASSSRSSIPRASGRCAPTGASRPSSARRRSTRRGSRTAGHLHVSGYALLREPVRFAAIAGDRARARRGARVSIDLSSWSAIRDFGAGAVPRASSTSSRPTSCSRTRTRTSDRRRPARRAHLDPQARRGRGVVRRRRARSRHVSRRSSTRPAPATRFAAGWLVGGPDLALEAAARCVQHAGSMPEPLELGSRRCAT